MPLSGLESPEATWSLAFRSRSRRLSHHIRVGFPADSGSLAAFAWSNAVAAAPFREPCSGRNCLAARFRPGQARGTLLLEIPKCDRVRGAAPDLGLARY